MTRFAEPFIAVDWGTTNRRAFRIEGATSVATARGPGVAEIKPGGFPAEIAAIRAQLGDWPMLLAGMVGSTIGWHVAPYVAAPAGREALVAGLLWVDGRTAIVPGLSLLEGNRADVMRGEEVQLFGAVAAGLAPADAVLVQPGTHCKWVRMRAGRIASFTTAMTGELFALLRGHSILAPQLGAPVQGGDAFLAGVAEASTRDLPSALFGIRAAKLLGQRDDADAASFLSGLLIGADVAAALAREAVDTVTMLADPELGALYAAAITANGRSVRMIDSQAAFLAGISHIGNLV